MTTEDEWRDIWLEYRSFWHRYRLTEDRVRTVITAALELVPDTVRDPADRCADALKEFVLRAADRGVHADGDPLLTELWRAGRALETAGDQLGELNAPYYAVRLFGTAAEDLGPDVCRRLAELVGADRRELGTT